MAAGNAVPMMFLKKPGKANKSPQLHIVSDLRAQNADTYKIWKEYCRGQPVPNID